MEIPHSQPFLGKNEIEALKEVIRARFLSYGDKARELGKQGAMLLKKSWGIATQSGTDALTLAVKLLNLKEGDKILVPAYICSAPLDALALCKITPIPVDIEKKTLSISINRINNNYETNAVICAHLFGIPAPFYKIQGKTVIEDCAQTLLTDINGYRVGSIGKYSICSFYATKLLTTAHGGLIAGNFKKDFKRAMKILVHDKQKEWMPHFHFLCSDLNAAIGISQIKQLPFFIEERKRIAKRFIFAVTGEEKISNSIYSRFITVVKGKMFNKVKNAFEKAGIEAKRPVYKPLYKYLGYKDGDFPNAKWAHDHILSIPLYPGMPEKHILKIEKVLREHKHELSIWPPA